MRYSIVSFLSLLAAMLIGCAHDSRPQPSASDIVITDSKNMLAFRQQAEADLVVEFMDWDEIRIDKPTPSSTTEGMKKDSFLQAIGRADMQRRFAVVVMDKRWSIASDRVSLDELEMVMRGAGFQRVVFQQARGVIDLNTGLPILRDTAERQ